MSSFFEQNARRKAAMLKMDLTKTALGLACVLHGELKFGSLTKEQEQKVIRRWAERTDMDTFVPMKTRPMEEILACAEAWNERALTTLTRVIDMVHAQLAEVKGLDFKDPIFDMLCWCLVELRDGNVMTFEDRYAFDLAAVALEFASLKRDLPMGRLVAWDAPGISELNYGSTSVFSIEEYGPFTFTCRYAFAKPQAAWKVFKALYGMMGIKVDTMEIDQVENLGIFGDFGKILSFASYVMENSALMP